MTREFRRIVRVRRSNLIVAGALACVTIHVAAICRNMRRLSSGEASNLGAWLYPSQMTTLRSRLTRPTLLEDGEDSHMIAGSLPPFYGRTQVVFDVLGTVVRDPLPDVASSFFGMSLPELGQVTNESAWVAFERGAIDEKQFAATYFRDGREFDLFAFKIALSDGFEFIDGMQELLQDLSEAGHTIRGFTNYPEWYTLIEQKLGLEANYGLEWTCVSCDTGFRKPELAAYLHLLQRLGAVRKLGAAPVLLVETSAESCKHAERTGISSLKFEDAPMLRRTLGDMLGSRKQGTAPVDGWPARVLRWVGPSPPDGWLSQ